MFEISDTRPSSMLMEGVASNNIPKILEAIKLGANLNETMLDASPLLVAVHRGFLDAARVLVDNGCNPNVGNRLGWTSVHEAAQKCDLDVLNILNNAIISWNKKDHYGHTPLRVAMEQVNNPGQKRMLEAILNQVIVSPNVPDEDGLTPLMRSVELKDADLVVALLNKGGDPTLLNNEKKSAVDLAADWPEAPRALFNKAKEMSKVGEDAPVVEEGAVSSIRKRRPS
jgi:ankyrin repeat protein